MCVIIDANVAHEFGSIPPHCDARPVVEWVANKNGRIAIGGKLSEELFKTRIRRWMLELIRNGSAVQYPNNGIDSEADRLDKVGLCTSDDPHIIALACRSGARLLYTKDARLQQDFKNKKLVDRPRGRIYSSHLNADLLQRCPQCKDP